MISRVDIGFDLIWFSIDYVPLDFLRGSRLGIFLVVVVCGWYLLHLVVFYVLRFVVFSDMPFWECNPCDSVVLCRYVGGECFTWWFFTLLSSFDCVDFRRIVRGSPCGLDWAHTYHDCCAVHCPERAEPLQYRWQDLYNGYLSYLGSDGAWSQEAYTFYLHQLSHLHILWGYTAILLVSSSLSIISLWTKKLR